MVIFLEAFTVVMTEVSRGSLRVLDLEMMVCFLLPCIRSLQMFFLPEHIMALCDLTTMARRGDKLVKACLQNSGPLQLLLTIGIRMLCIRQPKTSKGIFASPDAGDSWISINKGLPTLEHRIRDNVAQNLKITADGKALILGLVDYGVWRLPLRGIGNRNFWQ